MPDAPFRVALTFDAEHPDRPTEAGVHGAIVSALERHGVRATFFVQGRWVEAYPALARALPDGGHLVGNHSFYHARMQHLTATGFRSDVRRAERVIRDVVQTDPRPWFRLPFGAGAASAVVARRLEALGYRHVHWDVDGRDWLRRLAPRALEDRLVNRTVERGDGSIVLMHSWPAVTDRALDGLIRRLRSAGATFVTVDELPAE